MSAQCEPAKGLPFVSRSRMPLPGWQYLLARFAREDRYAADRQIALQGSRVEPHNGLKVARGVVAMCVVLFAAPTRAHHSHGNYADTFTDVAGTVKEVHLISPHSWVYLEVKAADGELHIWALEATSRAGLERIGVTRDYIKPGDAIKARCHPLRDGSRGCLLGFVKAKDGSVKDWDGNNLPIPADF